MKAYLYFLLSVSFFVFSCNADKASEVVEPTSTVVENSVSFTAAQIEQAGIDTGRMVYKSINETVQVNGMVDVPPQNIVSISFPMGGYIKRSDILPGQKISKGGILAIIEDQGLVQLQEDYLIGKSKLQYLEKEYARQEELHKANINAEKVWQQTQADFQAQKILVKAGAEKLQLVGINPDNLNDQNISRSVTLRSPISGFVSKVNMNIGKYVGPTDVLYEIINPDDLHAALTVFQKDLGKVVVGQEVNISFVEEPKTVYKGKVILVNQQVDENRGALLHCHFINHPAQLKPGMFLNAGIIVNKQNQWLVPEQAVCSYGGKQYIFVASGGSNQFTMEEITTGTKENDLIAVVTGYEKLINKAIIIRNAFTALGSIKNAAE
jgi:cobalt-zinc-cadmium efflux system membrane fusion protein